MEWARCLVLLLVLIGSIEFAYAKKKHSHHVPSKLLSFLKSSPQRVSNIESKLEKQSKAIYKLAQNYELLESSFADRIALLETVVAHLIDQTDGISESIHEITKSFKKNGTKQTQDFGRTEATTGRPFYEDLEENENRNVTTDDYDNPILPIGEAILIELDDDDDNDDDAKKTNVGNEDDTPQLIGTSVQPPSECELIPTDDLHENSTAYFLCEKKLDWQSAREHCQKYGMDLAAIKNNAIYANVVRSFRRFLTKNWIRSVDVWLGGSDLESEGEWYWVKDNEPVTWAKWSRKEPNNRFGKEHCMRLVKRGYRYEFHDFKCSSEVPFICEKTQE